LDGFKNIGSNVFQDLIKIQTYKKIFKGITKEKLQKECIDTSLEEIQKLGIF